MAAPLPLVGGGAGVFGGQPGPEYNLWIIYKLGVIFVT